MITLPPGFDVALFFSDMYAFALPFAGILFLIVSYSVIVKILKMLIVIFGLVVSASSANAGLIGYFCESAYNTGSFECSYFPDYEFLVDLEGRVLDYGASGHPNIGFKMLRYSSPLDSSLVVHYVVERVDHQFLMGRESVSCFHCDSYNELEYRDYNHPGNAISNIFGIDSSYLNIRFFVLPLLYDLSYSYVLNDYTNIPLNAQQYCLNIDGLLWLALIDEDTGHYYCRMADYVVINPRNAYLMKGAIRPFRRSNVFKPGVIIGYEERID